MNTSQKSMNLSYYKDKHKGQGAVIIAGGPSLKNTRLSAFPADFLWLGVSLVYKGVTGIDYQFIGDKNIYSQVYNDFTGQEFKQLFVSKGIYGEYPTPINTTFFTGASKGFYGEDVTKGVYGGGTSSYLAMQFAFYMGFNPVFIVGLDHNWDFDYTEKIGQGKGGDLLIHSGKDNNHFIEDFYPNDIKWFKPKTDKMLESYKMAGEAYKKAGRALLNASIVTKVPHDVIPRYNNLGLVTERWI